MKNKEEILESGILEQYVLGLTNVQESRLAEQYLAQYPELKEHLDTIERAMELIAQQNAIVPPEHLREATLKRIEEEESLSFKASSFKLKWITGIAAAIGLLAVAYGWNVNNQLNDLTSEVVDLQQKVTTANLDCALIKDDYNTNRRLLEMYMDEDINPVKLAGNNLLPGADLIVFWDSNKEKACIKINTMDAPPEDHIYQIWADVNGEMKSLGTFLNEKTLIDINYLENAESLNVTIERGEGSEHPDVTRLVMSSKV